MLNTKRGRDEDPAKDDNKNRQSPMIPHPKKSKLSRINQAESRSTNLFGIDDLVQINQEDAMHKSILHKLVSGLGAFASAIHVEAIHKNVCSTIVSHVRYQSFLLFAQAMDKRCNGNPNRRYVWYGTSKEEIINIVSNGFFPSNHLYGVEFSAPNHPLDCLQTAIQDEHGLRYLLVCKVVLGKLEEVCPGSAQQTHPSSQDLHSGVDNLRSPRKYRVWSSQLNTQVFPEYVVSFRVPCSDSKEVNHNPTVTKNLSLPSIPFDALVTRLSKILPSHAIDLIESCQNDHQEKKFNVQEFLRKVNEVTGKSLIIALIKSMWAKQRLTQENR